MAYSVANCLLDPKFLTPVPYNSLLRQQREMFLSLTNLPSEHSSSRSLSFFVAKCICYPDQYPTHLFAFTKYTCLTLIFSRMFQILLTIGGDLGKARGVGGRGRRRCAGRRGGRGGWPGSWAAAGRASAGPPASGS